MLRFTTAGESHDRALIAIIEGLPADLPVDAAFINRQLARRQWGYGRGGRMKIEQDTAEFISGVRHGRTTGAPIALMIENKDWKNWTDVMAAEELTVTPERDRRLSRPRPGHADLAGGLKYNTRDLRNILERASARETTARVAAGALARRLLEEFGVEVRSHVVQLGGIPEQPLAIEWSEIDAIPDDAPLHCADREAQQKMIELIDDAKREGDTLGGIFEVVVRGLTPGLGSHTSWDSKLDGQLAQAITSIPAVKAFELGAGVGAVRVPGSQVHDEIAFNSENGNFTRRTNRAGGLEGGITNGEELRVRGYLKPIATLRKRLGSVDIDTKAEELAGLERSDTTAVPAAGVIGEAMVSLVLGRAMREKFGGDSLAEMQRNFDGYQQQIKNY